MSDQTSGVIPSGDCFQGESLSNINKYPEKGGELTQRRWKTKREKAPRSWQIENNSICEAEQCSAGREETRNTLSLKYKWDQLKGEQEALGTWEWFLSF